MKAKQIRALLRHAARGAAEFDQRMKPLFVMGSVARIPLSLAARQARKPRAK